MQTLLVPVQKACWGKQSLRDLTKGKAEGRGRGWQPWCAGCGCGVCSTVERQHPWEPCWAGMALPEHCYLQVECPGSGSIPSGWAGRKI